MGPAFRENVRQALEAMRTDPTLAAVRDDDALMKLPEAEHREWQKLWENVETLRQRAAQQPKAASSARP